MVLDDFKRGVPSRQSLAIGTIGRPDDFGSQLAGRVEVIIVQLELDVLIVVEPGSLGRFPRPPMKKDVVTEVIRIDEAEFSVGADELDPSQPFFLNPKRLWCVRIPRRPFDFRSVAARCGASWTAGNG